jgi:hypothetical protein
MCAFLSCLIYVVCHVAQICRDLNLLKDVSDVSYFSDFFQTVCSREEVIIVFKCVCVCMLQACIKTVACVHFVSCL